MKYKTVSTIVQLSKTVFIIVQLYCFSNYTTLQDILQNCISVQDGLYNVLATVQDSCDFFYNRSTHKAVFTTVQLYSSTQTKICKPH